LVNELGEPLADAGISIKPTYLFTDDFSEYSDYFRIGFGDKMMRDLSNSHTWQQTPDGFMES